MYCDVVWGVFEVGVGCFMFGNYVWYYKDIYLMFSEDIYFIVWFFNYVDFGIFGVGWCIFDVNGEKLMVVNLFGWVFMEVVDNFFWMMDVLFE